MSQDTHTEGREVHIQSVPWQTDTRAILEAAMGPPAWIVRKRRIEDEEDRIRARARELWLGLAFSIDNPREFGARWRQELSTLSLAEVNRLIESHNKYYVAEANLPSNPVTRQIIDITGQPYQPWPLWSVDRLLEEFKPDYEVAQAAR